MRNNYLISFAIILGTFGSQSHATKCGEFIYNKHCWLKHYEWLPNTATENTKKNGIASSTIRPSTENSTAAVDPGVSTGASTGSSQSMSSWGECSWWARMTGKSTMLEKYMEQNLDQIKKQAALGKGGHMVSIALMSGCRAEAGQRLGVLLQ